VRFKALIGPARAVGQSSSQVNSLAALSVGDLTEGTMPAARHLSPPDPCGLRHRFSGSAAVRLGHSGEEDRVRFTRIAAAAMFGTAAALVIVIPSEAQPRGRCNAALWRHVYNPGRLEVVEKCTSVTGTILDWRVEKDGDYHILLRLDAGQSHLLNGKNRERQHGCLVLEPICKRDVTQLDAIQACEGAPQVRVPEKGSHVRVWGSYVHDAEGGHGWMEMHPVSRFEVLE
jgi:hypothetical protein